MRKVPVDIEILRKYLPENELVKITEAAEAKRENCKLYMREYRKNYKNDCKNYTNGCETHKSKNGEIGSKTAFSAENSGKNYARGGVGGVLLNNDTFKNINDTFKSTSSTLLKDDVTSKINLNLKEKNTKKRKENCEIHTKNCEAHAAKKTPECSKEFFELYDMFPRKKGKAKGLESLARMERKGELPPFGHVKASLEIDIQMWKNERRTEDKIPYFSTWVNSRSWEDLPEAKLEARMPGTPLETQAAASAALPGKPEMLKHARASGIAEEIFHEWHRYGEETGWTGAKGPITGINWQSALKGYARRWRERQAAGSGGRAEQ